MWIDIDAIVFIGIIIMVGYVIISNHNDNNKPPKDDWDGENGLI